jgi:hypothetical protein
VLAVRHLTEWFEVRSGLRQGCSLSPIMFNLFMNDLAVKIRALDLGIDIGGENVCILLYADDVVLLADKEDDLQEMLHALSDWCKMNGMSINSSKSNVIHFRPRNCVRSHNDFKCGDETIDYCDKYKCKYTLWD